MLVFGMELLCSLQFLTLDILGFLSSQFSGAGEEKLKQATAAFCSNQPFALEVIKSRQKKDSRFQTFIQVNLARSSVCWGLLMEIKYWVRPSMFICDSGK